jgi:hypothetical protein
MIPYKIHHIWLQGGIPEEYRENYDKWDAFLFGWEHRVWDEKALLELCTAKQKKVYRGLESLINRVNYLKYILLFNEGGIFSDLDSYPIGDLYKFFVQDEIHDINLQALLAIRYPFNTGIPRKPFGDYEVIIPARRALSHYPDGSISLLLDNPVLMSTERNLFWLELLKWCEGRKDFKDLTHEPYGPYGLTDFVFRTYRNPYNDGILILPSTYLMGWEGKPTENMYIQHQANRAWQNID